MERIAKIYPEDLADIIWEKIGEWFRDNPDRDVVTVGMGKQKIKVTRKEYEEWKRIKEMHSAHKVQTFSPPERTVAPSGSEQRTVVSPPSPEQIAKQLDVTQLSKMSDAELEQLRTQLRPLALTTQDVEIRNKFSKVLEEIDRRNVLKTLRTSRRCDMMPRTVEVIKRYHLSGGSYKPIYASVEVISRICPECAEKMKQAGIKSIDVRPILAARWESLPRGWTRKSLESFWESIGGSVTKCIKKMKGHVSDPEAFCAALKDRILGTTKWRGKE